MMCNFNPYICCIATVGISLDGEGGNNPPEGKTVIKLSINITFSASLGIRGQDMCERNSRVHFSIRPPFGYTTGMLKVCFS